MLQMKMNVLRRWHSRQNVERGINGHILRERRRLFSFQDRNWPSLSQKKTTFCLEKKWIFLMFSRSASYMCRLTPLIIIWGCDGWIGLGAPVTGFHTAPKYFTQPPNRVNSYFGCLSPPHLQQGHLWCVQWVGICSINLLFQTCRCWCYFRETVWMCDLAKLFPSPPLPLNTSSQASKLH